METQTLKENHQPHSDRRFTETTSTYTWPNSHKSQRNSEIKTLIMGYSTIKQLDKRKKKLNGHKVSKSIAFNCEQATEKIQ